MKIYQFALSKKVEMNTFALSKIVLFALIIVNEKSTKMFQCYNLGKLGALSMKTGKQKVASDADPEYDIRGEKKRAESQDSSVPSKKATRGRRGKLPSFVASKNSVSSNLPWPSAAGLAERIAMPSTLARTTSSAVSSEPPRASIRPSVINIDTSLGSNNSLLAHISKYGLGLKSRAAIPGDGNCWYNSNVDLIKEFKLKAPTDHLELRKAVVNSMKNHLQMNQWVHSIFHGKKRDYNRFLKEKSR